MKPIPQILTNWTRFLDWFGFGAGWDSGRKPPVDKIVSNNVVKTACYKFVKKLLRCLLTTRRVKAYKPLTDEDGGAAGADDLLRSDVSLETAGFVGVICWKAVILLVWF